MRFPELVGRAHAGNPFFGLPDREAPAQDFLGQPLLVVRRRQRRQARAWPAESAPDRMWSRTLAGASTARALVTSSGPFRPVRDLLVGSRNSSLSRAYPRPRRAGSVLALEVSRAHSSRSLSDCFSRHTTGTFVRPASAAARHRRSPATISSFSPRGVTTIGWRCRARGWTRRARRASPPDSRRGWNRFGTSRRSRRRARLFHVERRRPLRSAETRGPGLVLGHAHPSSSKAPFRERDMPRAPGLMS